MIRPRTTPFHPLADGRPVRGRSALQPKLLGTADAPPCPLPCRPPAQPAHRATTARTPGLLLLPTVSISEAVPLLRQIQSPYLGP